MRRYLAVVLLSICGVQPSGFAAEISFSPAGGGFGRVQTSVQSLLEQRWQHVVRQGLDISCGSATLSTILRYQFGDEVSERVLLAELFKRLRPEEVAKRGGFSLLDLKDVATKLGYQVKGYKLSFDQLVALGTPAIVPIVIRGSKHFIVLRGMVGDRVVLADPAFGTTMVSQEQFERLWVTKTAMVITRPGAKPPASQLAIAPNELAAVEPREALRSLLNRPAAYTVVDPDAF